MQKLIEGIRQFQSSYVPSHQALMKELSKGQSPRVLFIGCSDSRVSPEIITQSEIGDLFIIRNAGNIVPPFEASNGGEGATIEYAIEALDIQQVIVCGHSQCGAMKGLLQLGELEEKMPLVYEWLRLAEATRKLVNDNYGHLDKKEMIDALVAENVLTQIENLRTYPVIRSKLYRGDLSIHAWVYKIETGEVLTYDSEHHAFCPPNGVKTSKNAFQEPYVAPQSHLPGVTRLPREQCERIYRGSVGVS
ncbi:carbonic anhydrase [Oscillatoria sp. CS-180]|uniref:carbonic anhydrase n=1 Tax=Oscillatoria sp. CS-180 TaxID=3021720 RepID=UPI00232C64DB|nr:carbonic anhydrase [Oscillatoria sp. CS-180]MDB9529080.1 carbonic anhydrase [Oscillatoria sp. CS-180]